MAKKTTEENTENITANEDNISENNVTQNNPEPENNSPDNPPDPQNNPDPKNKTEDNKKELPDGYFYFDKKLAEEKFPAWQKASFRTFCGFAPGKCVTDKEYKELFSEFSDKYLGGSK